MNLAPPYWRLIDSFTVPLHSPKGRHFPAFRVVPRDCQWHLKNVGNSHWLGQPMIQSDTGQSQSIFGPTKHKRWCQPIGGCASYPTDSPTATKLRLCNSLEGLAVTGEPLSLNPLWSWAKWGHTNSTYLKVFTFHTFRYWIFKNSLYAV